MRKNHKIKKLTAKLKNLYARHGKNLPFHGWHHIVFVRHKAIEFGRKIGADLFLVESAALVHDLNYITKINSNPEAGLKLRQKVLADSKYSEKEIKRIENIIKESHTATRSEKISSEGKALSDADTLFKSLPITPIIFSSEYIKENKVDIGKLAEKICKEQNKLLKNNIYFYTPFAKKKYLRWVKINLTLWNNVIETLKDEDVIELISLFKKIKN